MPPRFLVQGGRPLRGTVRPAGNKNAALPILAATILADGPVDLENIPRIRDVETMLALLVDLGASAEWTGANSVRVDARGVKPKPLDPGLCAKIRASILLAGPMLARFGSVTLPPPGGDVIGRRRVDTHFLALEHLGASVMVGDRYELEAKELKGDDIFLDEPSVTGTENALMAAVMAKGRTVLRNAACEPHVQDLARCLVAMGAEISGIGSNIYTIEGGRPLAGTSYTIGPDHIEIGSFIGLAAVTNGDIVIEPVRQEDLRSTILGFERLGIRPKIEGNRLTRELGAGAENPSRPRRPRAEAGGRAVARVSGRRHVHHHRHGHPVLRHAAGLREDVRVPALLRGQADRHGRAHRALRSPPGGDLGALPPQGRHGRVAGHPGRHGHGPCGAGGGRPQHHS